MPESGEVVVAAFDPDCDGDAFVGLSRRHAEYERATLPAPGLLTATRVALAAGRLHVWLAHLGGSPVGYASAAAEWSTWKGGLILHMDCLFVDGAYRGRGIGAALVERVVEHAVDAGIDEVQWQTPSWNVRAQRFYDRLGATGADKRRFTLKASAQLGRASS